MVSDVQIGCKKVTNTLSHFSVACSPGPKHRRIHGRACSGRSGRHRAGPGLPDRRARALHPAPGGPCSLSPAGALVLCVG